MVQAEIKRRQQNGRQDCGDNPLSGKIVCGECGGLFGSKGCPVDGYIVKYDDTNIPDELLPTDGVFATWVYENSAKYIISKMPSINIKECV